VSKHRLPEKCLQTFLQESGSLPILIVEAFEAEWLRNSFVAAFSDARPSGSQGNQRTSIMQMKIYQFGSSVWLILSVGFAQFYVVFLARSVAYLGSIWLICRRSNLNHNLEFIFDVIKARVIECYSI